MHPTDFWEQVMNENKPVPTVHSGSMQASPNSELGTPGSMQASPNSELGTLNWELRNINRRNVILSPIPAVPLESL